jgi:hypothetical protein
VDMLETKSSYDWFCWMCQLSVFASLKQLPQYNIHHLDESRTPFQRFGLHVKYELWGSYNETVILVTRQALCRYLTTRLLPECETPQTRLDYLRYKTFVYEHSILNLKTTQDEGDRAYNITRDRFLQVLETVVRQQ